MLVAEVATVAGTRPVLTTFPVATAVDRPGTASPAAASGPRTALDVPPARLAAPVLVLPTRPQEGQIQQVAPLVSAGHIADSAIVSCPATAPTVPTDYAGLSIEWSMVRYWFGTSRTSVNTSLVNILNSLELGSNTPGVLRIGGNSQDGYRWDQTGSTTGNTLFSGTINGGLVDALFEVARRSGWKVIVGLNLRNNDPAMALSLARYIVGQDTGGNLRAFEIGNEPNAYLTGSEYLARYRTYVDRLNSDPATAAKPVTGPAISNNADVTWAHDLWTIYRPTGQLLFATWHDYANAANLASLLQTSQIVDYNTRIGAMDGAVGRRNHRMDEGNDTGHGGLDGVSNVLGKTAWLIDALLDGAARGLQGYNNHSWDGYYYPADNLTSWYTPFVIRNGQASARPGFYALALFKYALGRRFCGVSTSNATGQLVRTWAVNNPSINKIYAYAINKGGAGKSGTVGVIAPAGHNHTGFLNIMSGPGGCYGRTTNIQGSTLPAGGSYSWTGRALNPVPGTTRYQFTLPECSTALLSIP